MAKVSRPLVYALIGTLCLAGYLLMQGEEQPTSVAAKKKAASTSKKNTDLLPEDYDAFGKYARIDGGTKNSFIPVVMKSDRMNDPSQNKPNSIPTDLTGGEQNWEYTGTAEIDSVPSALFENTSTGEAVFLKQSDSWKKLVVKQITPEYVVVTGSNGVDRMLKLTWVEVNRPIADATGATGDRPMNPNQPGLNGPIGRRTAQNSAAGAQESVDFGAPIPADFGG